MRKKRNDIRRLIVLEAARLMFEDGVEQYLDAKRKAAKRILGKQMKDLPSNGEISEALFSMAKFHQGDEQNNTLFAMRLRALEVMEQLDEFNPRLIGSVSSGRIRKGSDIDIHVFTDSLEQVQSCIELIGWDYQIKQVLIQKGSKALEFSHIYLEFEYPVELSVYPLNEIRIRGRSSTDGKPIERLSASKLRDLIMTEHAEYWCSYLEGNSTEIFN